MLEGRFSLVLRHCRFGLLQFWLLLGMSAVVRTRLVGILVHVKTGSVVQVVQVLAKLRVVAKSQVVFFGDFFEVMVGVALAFLSCMCDAWLANLKRGPLKRMVIYYYILYIIFCMQYVLYYVVITGPFQVPC